MASCFLFSCFSGNSTANIPAVPAVDLPRYAGTWYEIARLDHSFERDLTHVTATYTLNGNGSVGVLNQGKKDGKTSTANGKARLLDPNQPGVLKVRFFGPFGGLYKIIALDAENYQFAMVTSGTRGYLWILSRTPRMDEALYQSLLDKARAWKFDVQALVRVAQD
jgi:lipocalin